jgi:hypothetical protein
MDLLSVKSLILGEVFLRSDVDHKNRNYLIVMLAGVVAGSSVTAAQESLSTCIAEKTRQMELTRSIKSAPPPRIDPHTHRPYTTFDAVRAQQDVNRIDEWLWKNCRENSEEMRKIEQQYM